MRAKCCRIRAAGRRGEIGEAQTVVRSSLPVASTPRHRGRNSGHVAIEAGSSHRGRSRRIAYRFVIFCQWI
jgi:hypothetical protein